MGLRSCFLLPPACVNLPAETFARVAAYQRITRVERRAKYMLFHLDSSHVLLLHLLLNGWMYYTEGDEAPGRTIARMSLARDAAVRSKSGKLLQETLSAVQIANNNRVILCFILAAISVSGADIWQLLEQRCPWE